MSQETKAKKFFEKWRREIGPDYKRKGNVVHCGLLADAFGRIFAEEGRDYELKCFHAKDWREALKPGKYPGIEWGSHIVCLANGKFWDPMLPEPTPEKDYAEKAFPGQETITRTLEKTIRGENPYEMKRSDPEMT